MKRYRMDLSATVEEESKHLTDRMIQFCNESVQKSETTIREEMKAMETEINEELSKNKNRVAYLFEKIPDLIGQATLQIVDDKYTSDKSSSKEAESD